VHLAKDQTFSANFASGCGASYESMFENVIYYDGSEYHDWTYTAFGYQWWSHGHAREDYFFTFGEANSLLYFLKLNPFTEIHVNLAEAASADWQGIFEYWNGQEWAELPLKLDTTNNFTKSGYLAFDPPEEDERISFLLDVIGRRKIDSQLLRLQRWNELQRFRRAYQAARAAYPDQEVPLWLYL
jgi:hypothetical protein